MQRRSAVSLLLLLLGFGLAGCGGDTADVSAGPVGDPPIETTVPPVTAEVPASIPSTTAVVVTTTEAPMVTAPPATSPPPTQPRPVPTTPATLPPITIAVPDEAPAAGCDPSYPGVCIPSGPDLDCPDIPFRRFAVVGADPHRFDADHDGIGCESG